MKNQLLTNFFLALFTFLAIGTVAQTYIPGEIYFDSTGFVEYRPGNLPIILSAPHGGNWRPDSIPDRNCDGCVYSIDSYTRVITWGMYDAIVEQTGCYPHMIMNRLHRVKFDANRDIDDAADGNPLVERAWQSYHDFINVAKDHISSEYERGLFLDIHGHAHEIQRIELGYLLSRSELQLSDSVLNTTTYIEESSIRTLVDDNLQGISHAELLRGESSFGTFLNNRGFPSVPSSSDPFPNDGEAFFSGGYNTVRHGSRDNNAAIDAIQIELNQDARFDATTRAILIDSLTAAAVEYMDTHYEEQFSNNLCNYITSQTYPDLEELDFRVYPNPSSTYIRIEEGFEQAEILFYNSLGQHLLTREISNSAPINIAPLPTGFIFFKIRKNDVNIGYGQLVKR